MNTIFLLRIKCVLVSMLLTVVTQLVVGQTVERGRILEYKGNAQKTPLPGVELNVKGASTVTSDAKGFFITKSPLKSQGSQYSIMRYTNLDLSSLIKMLLKRGGSLIHSVYFAL